MKVNSIVFLLLLLLVIGSLIHIFQTRRRTHNIQR